MRDVISSHGEARHVSQKTLSVNGDACRPAADIEHDHPFVLFFLGQHGSGRCQWLGNDLFYGDLGLIEHLHQDVDR